MRDTHCLGVPLSVNVDNDVNVARNIFIDHIVRCFSSEILKSTLVWGPGKAQTN